MSFAFFYVSDKSTPGVVQGTPRSMSVESLYRTKYRAAVFLMCRQLILQVVIRQGLIRWCFV